MNRSADLILPLRQSYLPIINSRAAFVLIKARTVCTPSRECDRIPPLSFPQNEQFLISYLSKTWRLLHQLLLRRMAPSMSHGSLLALTGFIVPTIIILVSSLVVYRRWFHPLAKIPGPFFASITHYYIVKFNLFSKRSQFYLQIEKLHQRYGTKPSLVK